MQPEKIKYHQLPIGRTIKNNNWKKHEDTTVDQRKYKHMSESFIQMIILNSTYRYMWFTSMKYKILSVIYIKYRIIQLKYL